MNSRRIDKKQNELQALSIGNDLVFCVESWLNPNYLNCELLPSSSDVTIYRRDRKNRGGCGVFLAVKNRLPSIRRSDLETDAEILVCELRPDSRRKILAVVFYRPHDTDLEYLKQLKKTLLLLAYGTHARSALGSQNCAILSILCPFTGNSAFRLCVNDIVVDLPRRKDATKVFAKST